MDPDEFVADSQSEDEAFWNEVDKVTQRVMETSGPSSSPSNAVTSAVSVSVDEPNCTNAKVDVRAMHTTPASPSLPMPLATTASESVSHGNVSVAYPEARDPTTTEAPSSGFKEGDLVEVETRTWPGINKIGGAARVTRAYEENGVAMVDVRYFLGGSERAVAIEYVQPSSIYEKKSRQRRSRKFFHDEFADEYLPARRLALDAAAVVTPAAPTSRTDDHVVANTTKVRKPAKKAGQTAKLVDLTHHRSNSSSSSNDDDYDIPLSRRFHNLEKLAKPATAAVAQGSTNTAMDKQVDESDAAMPPFQGSHDVVSVLESHTVLPPASSSDARRRTKQNTARRPPRTRILPSSDGDDDSDDSDDQVEVAHPRRKKKRRFVGGYDGDNDFIQPEDNAMDLPEDVQHDTGFTLATTSKLLKEQYQKHSVAFASALHTFQSLREAPFDPANLHEMEHFHKQHLVREEDIVDAVLRRLEAKGKSISAVENLKHDQRKSQVNEHAVWLKGRRDLYGLARPSEPSTAATMSSESDDDDYGMRYRLPDRNRREIFERDPRQAKGASVHRSRRSDMPSDSSGESESEDSSFERSQSSHRSRQTLPPARHFSAEESAPSVALQPSTRRSDLFSDDDADDDRPPKRKHVVPSARRRKRQSKLAFPIESTPPSQREYQPQTMRAVPPAILASSEWNWKGLVKHKRQSSHSSTAQDAPRTARNATSHTSKWKLRVYRAPVAPGSRSKTVQRQTIQPETSKPFQTIPAVVDSIKLTPEDGRSILDHTSDAIPVGWQPTLQDLELLSTQLTSVAPQATHGLPPWYHSTPIFVRTSGFVSKLIRTLRHLLIDLQHAEAKYMEQEAGALDTIEASALEDLSKKCAVLISELRRQHSVDPINLDEIRWLVHSLPRIHALLAATPSYYYFFELTESSMTVLLQTICTLHCHALAMDPPSMLDATLLFLLEYHMHFSSFGVALSSPVLSLWQQILHVNPDFWKCFDGLTHKPRVKALAKTLNPLATTSEIDMILRETIWDIVVWLAPLPDRTLPSNWMLVGSLLSNSEALPFSHTFQNVTAASDALVDLYRKRILQRVLVLSAAWAPSHVPVVMIVLKLMQVPPKAKSPRLPPFLMELALKPAERDAILTYEIDDCDCSDLMGRVIVMQMMQFDKPVLRNRFRHPVLNALKHQPKKIENAQWNWTNPKEPVNVPTTRVDATPTTHIHHIALVSMVLATTMTDDLKTFKRDLSFYTSEILRVAPDNPTTAMHALWIVMTAIKSQLHLMPSLLTACNDLLVQMTKQPPFDADAIEFALHCVLQVAKSLVQTPVDSASLDHLAECVQGILSTGFDCVLQQCFKNALPPSVLSMATSILVCLCPHAPEPPPPPPTSDEFDEFDDPEEMALLASLDVVTDTQVVVQLKYRHVLGVCADNIFKLLRVSLQKLALHQYASTAALTAAGVLLAHVTTFQWDILQASSKGPTVFVFPRVLAMAISNCPTKYVANFLATHPKADVALLHVWLLTLVDPCPDYWDALAGHLTTAQPTTSLLHVLHGCTPPLGTSKSFTSSDRVMAFHRFCTNVVDRYHAAGDQANAMRAIFLDLHHGVFAQWMDACSAALQSLCRPTPPEWKYIHALFDDSVNFRQHEDQLLHMMAASRKANATVATIQYCRGVYTYLSTMFRLWGPMARGTHLIFATFLREFFPSAAFAQHDHAAELLFATTQLFRTKPTAKTHWFASKLDKAWVSAVETLRAFFSVQATPALMDWVASTAQAYQLYSGGYDSSPLRTFALNLVDPDGPLGVSSYYPIVDSHVALSPVKRESDYVACALYNCSAHQGAGVDKTALRRFVLGHAMPQYVRSVQFMDDLCPVLQLLRASASHAHQYGGHVNPLDYLVALQACLEVLLPTFDLDLTATSCVLHVELLEWVALCALANDAVGDATMTAMTQLVVLRCFKLWSLLEPDTAMSINPCHHEAFLRVQQDLADHHRFTFGTALPMRPSQGGLNVFRAKGDVLVRVKRLLDIARASPDPNAHPL